MTYEDEMKEAKLRCELATLVRQRADTLADDALEPEERARNLPAARELMYIADRIDSGCNAEAEELQVWIQDHAKCMIRIRELDDELEASPAETEKLRDARARDRALLDEARQLMADEREPGFPDRFPLAGQRGLAVREWIKAFDYCTSLEEAEQTNSEGK